MSELILRHRDGVTRCGPFTFTAISLEVSGKPSFEEWAACGEFIQKAGGSVQWWVGDWLKYGECQWGEQYTQAIECTSMDYQALADCKWVASVFDFSCRHEKLSFKHHREVAPLPPEQADALLTRAEAEGLTTRALRQLVRQAKNAAALGNGSPSDDCCTVDDLKSLVERGEVFGCIYADPPWSYENQGTRASTNNHYGTMTVEEIAALPVGDIAAPESHLWLWTTNAFLFECPRLFAAWGFEFKSSYVWVKPQMGIGNYLRNSHEILLLAVRGGLVGAAKDVMSWGSFDRTEHSSKPERVRKEVVERVSPAPRLELFARQVAPGWVVWGNQIRRSMFDGDVKEIA